MDSPKVYCKKCRFCKVEGGYVGEGWSPISIMCYAEDAREDTYYERKRKGAVRCSDVNKNNDCPHFKKRKWWQF